MKEIITLHCYCCGIAYIRGRYRCCAPPSGMASHQWLAQWCRVDLGEGRRCNKCPRCGCEHRVKPKISGLEIGMAGPDDLAPKTRGELRELIQTIAAQPEKKPRKEWMPYRDREVGEEG